MKNYLLTRLTMGMMAALIAGSWLTGCSPSGVSAIDESVSSVEGMPTLQYPLSVNRTIETDQQSIEN